MGSRGSGESGAGSRGRGRGQGGGDGEVEGVADGHVHCWEMGSDHTHCRGRGQEIGQRHVWSPGAGAGAPLSSGSRPGLIGLYLEKDKR